MVPQVARHIGGREREEIVITLIASRIWTGQIYPPGEAPAGKEFHGAWRACPHKATEETCLTKHPFSHELAPFSRVSRSPCCCAAASRRTRTHRRLSNRCPSPARGTLCGCVLHYRKHLLSHHHVSQTLQSVCFTWPHQCVCSLGHLGSCDEKVGELFLGHGGSFFFFSP